MTRIVTILRLEDGTTRPITIEPIGCASCQWRVVNSTNVLYPKHYEHAIVKSPAVAMVSPSRKRQGCGQRRVIQNEVKA